MKKLSKQKTSNILLSSSSSRRKNAWQRLRTGGNRGLTQDQISKYLESLIKKQYESVRKEGALTYDKIQRYLDHLAKIASSTLAKTSMDPKKVESFSQKIEPVLTDIGTKQTLTERDVEKHSHEIRNQAINYVNEMSQPTSPKAATPAVEEELIEIELVDPEDGESEEAEMTTPVELMETPEPPPEKSEETIPIGFEEGAPKITINDFLTFPLGKDEKEPRADDWFREHEKYLQLAQKKGRLSEDQYEKAQPAFSSAPKIKYKKYHDIFPAGDYEDAVMMLIYTQWRNKILDNFRIDDE